MPPQAAWTPSPRYLTRLRQNLVSCFDEEELRALCSDLDTDYDDLTGQGRAGKARSMVAFLERRGRLSELAKICSRQRPLVNWEDTPDLPLADLENDFVNRQSELSLLHAERLRAALSPYVLVSAPAGYGKSYLMRRLIATMETDEVLCQKWGYRYVDLSRQIGDPITYLVQAITGQSLPHDPAAALDLVCKYVVQMLAGPLPEGYHGRRAVLLIFDAVERLDQATGQWLGKLLSDLRRRTRSGQTEIVTVRVIIAGRNVEPFWSSYAGAASQLPAPQRIELTPFESNPIQNLVWKQGRAVQVNLDERTVVEIASEMQFLSGGHPHIICSLVQELADLSFAIGPVAEHFEQHREQLVRKHLTPVADSLLDAAPPLLAEAARVLSIFRRVNANTVLRLVQAGALTMSANSDEIKLLGDLQKAHLLAKPSIQEPFYRSHLMRHILALDMAYSSRSGWAQHRRLNRIALDLYESWIHNLGAGLPDTPLKATQRLLSVVEWLYHALQDEAVDPDRIHTGLEKHMRTLSDGSTVLPLADLIVDEIVRDSEMCYLLRHGLGEEGVSTVCTWLKAV